MGVLLCQAIRDGTIESIPTFDRQSHVDHADRSRIVEHQVDGLDVAVDDSHCVRRFESASLDHKIQRLVGEPRHSSR